MNFSVSRLTDDKPLPSKDILEIQFGFRRFHARPIFSEYTSQNIKSKYCRFLPPRGQYCASVYAPTMLSTSCPVLIFEANDETNNTSATINTSAMDTINDTSASESVNTANDTLVNNGEAAIGWGCVIGPNANRLTIKRILLTGYIYKVHKRRCCVRYMFFYPEDIR
eukprot:GHVL01035982.1.p1 GENE.GHVL01035982.1~~GHVL01035982.1.p1  ORF type:complete len:167 (-),score=40.78 GHVL01035982.1:484-984(-)